MARCVLKLVITNRKFVHLLVPMDVIVKRVLFVNLMKLIVLVSSKEIVKINFDDLDVDDMNNI